MTWERDPDSVAIDAMTIPRDNHFFYALPAFAVILRGLQKIEFDQSEGIVIVTDWPAQPWFPMYMSMTTAERTSQEMQRR